ncbi:MAG: O-antigen ligase family protein, partial [Candidatus Sumerlaeia bacterium]|nr:O-antigen ligase family protein [Candidatus Sumerlaeia bacterium]
GGIPWGASRWNPRVMLLLPIGFVALFIVGLFMEGSIGDRLMNLLRFQDRANYYVSSWHLIHDAPLGVGMGMHSRAYESRFLEFWPWYQHDHVTAHSAWLHTLVEGGPLLPMMLLLGIGGLVVGYRRAMASMAGDEKRVVSAIAAGLAGLLVVSFMQYVFYIRVIELILWVGGGFLVGLYRLHRAGLPPEKDPTVPWGHKRLLLASGVGSLLVLSMTAYTFDPGKSWRQPDGNRESGFSFWTGASWRTAIPPGTSRVAFSLHRKATPCTVKIHGPNGKLAVFQLEPEEWRYVELDLDEVRNDGALNPIRWFEVEVSPVWRPSEVFEDSLDERALGVYFHELRMINER